MVDLLAAAGTTYLVLPAGDANIAHSFKLFALVIAYLALKGRYTERDTVWSESGLVLAALFMSVILETVDDASGPTKFDRLPTVLLASGIFFVGAFLGGRLMKNALSACGAWNVSVLLMGEGRTAAEAESALASDPLLGYRIVGRVAPLQPGTPGTLRALVRARRVDRLLLAIDEDASLQRSLVEQAICDDVPFSVVPGAASMPAFASHQTRFFSRDTVMLSGRSGLRRRVARFGKEVFDFTSALLLVSMLTPFLLLIALLVRLDGGPVLFAQPRIGEGGRTFRCFKFRTMVVDAEARLERVLATDPERAAEWLATRKLRDDPRITRIGRFLRKTSLDELPQLFNVLRCEMSLVGPRPIIASEMALYGRNIGQYLAARPGLTGLWQVSGRSDTTYAERVQLDAWYVNNWSLWHDVAVLLKTVPAVLQSDGAR